ncbi:hypothetical protein [Pseudorhodobacter sp.]|jgi:hypothetical protein|uniref:hypothetical protein n=1 Tax=Pseudorhodobacter sp. TaxID=1934400 RepID=UPI002AFEF0D9|nr:hypothetical protein [Pseudorhodobacter sp.]
MIGFAVCLGIGAVAMGLFSAGHKEFSYQSADEKNLMVYRCNGLGGGEDMESRARLAHAYFEPKMMRIAEATAKAMAQAMIPNRGSKEILADLEPLKAEMKSQLKAVDAEIQHRFGCRYKGSNL